jgi:hypothetical protein
LVSAVLRQACSLVLLLALFVPAAVECAGWKPSAEARKACCAAGTCAKESAQLSAGSKPIVSQADADDCCAASETQESDSPSPTHATLIAVADLQPAVFPATFDLTPATRRSERLEPPQATAVPRHLLLSVFLV